MEVLPNEPSTDPLQVPPLEDLLSSDHWSEANSQAKHKALDRWAVDRWSTIVADDRYSLDVRDKVYANFSKELDQARQGINKGLGEIAVESGKSLLYGTLEGSLALAGIPLAKAGEAMGVEPATVDTQLPSQAVMGEKYKIYSKGLDTPQWDLVNRNEVPDGFTYKELDQVRVADGRMGVTDLKNQLAKKSGKVLMRRDSRIQRMKQGLQEYFQKGVFAEESRDLLADLEKMSEGFNRESAKFHSEPVYDRSLTDAENLGDLASYVQTRNPAYLDQVVDRMTMSEVRREAETQIEAIKENVNEYHGVDGSWRDESLEYADPSEAVFSVAELATGALPLGALVRGTKAVQGGKAFLKGTADFVARGTGVVLAEGLQEAVQAKLEDPLATSEDQLAAAKDVVGQAVLTFLLGSGAGQAVRARKRNKADRVNNNLNNNPSTTQEKPKENPQETQAEPKAQDTDFIDAVYRTVEQVKQENADRRALEYVEEQKRIENTPKVPLDPEIEPMVKAVEGTNPQSWNEDQVDTLAYGPDNPYRTPAKQEWNRREYLRNLGVDPVKDELQAWIRQRGLLPHPSVAKTLQGELQDIYNSLNFGQRNAIFAKDGVDLDRLAEYSREDGYGYQTPDQLLQQLHESLRGNPQYPSFTEVNAYDQKPPKGISTQERLARKIGNFVKKISKEPARTQKQDFIFLGIPSERMAKDVQGLLEVDVSGYDLIFDEDVVRKNIKHEHIARKNRKFEPVNQNEYPLLANMVNHYDRVIPDVRGQNQAFIIHKRYGDTEYALSAQFEVRQGRKRLAITRFTKEKLDPMPHAYQSHDIGTLKPTPETSRVQAKEQLSSMQHVHQSHDIGALKRTPETSRIQATETIIEEDSSQSQEKSYHQGRDLIPVDNSLVEDSGLQMPAKDSLYRDVPLRNAPGMLRVEMPELVELAKELGARAVQIKKMRKATGMFQGRGSSKLILLNPDIFKDPVAAAKTLAHEIGHLVDYVPENIMKRGKILGRLFSLQKFMKDTYGPFGKYNGIDLRTELKNWTQYWKPFEEGTVPKSYLKYRYSSAELYADAVSGMLISPGMLEQKAPQFYKAFWSAIDRKPTVKTALMELQDILLAGSSKVLERREQRIHKAFGKGNELFVRRINERELQKRTGFKGFWDQFLQAFYDRYAPIQQRVKIVKQSGIDLGNNDAGRLLDEHPFSDSQIYLWLQGLHAKVVSPLQKLGFTQEAFGEYLLYNRVIGENQENLSRKGETSGRKHLANPFGETPETARNGLRRMRLRNGQNRYEALTEVAKKFYQLVYNQVLEGYKQGIYSEKYFQEELEPNKNNYATFQVLDYLQDYVPADVKKQVGTLKDIANPFVSTILKVISIHRLTEKQRTQNAVVNLMRDFFDDEIVTVNEDSNRALQIARENRPDISWASLSHLEDGKKISYLMPKDVTKSFDNPQNLVIGIDQLDKIFRSVFYPIIITYNPAFQLFAGPIRDMRKTFVNTPNSKGSKVIIKYLKNYQRLTSDAFRKVLRQENPLNQADRKQRSEDDLQSVRDYLKNVPNDLISEMLAVNAIGTPMDTFSRAYNREDQAYNEILKQMNLLPNDKQAGMLANIGKAPKALLRSIEYAGLTFEMLPKVSVYRILTREMGWKAPEAAAYIRNHSGVPNFRKTGIHTRSLQALVPFLNVFAKGYVDDAKLATGKESRMGWWLRYWASDGALTVLQASAEAGLLGDELEELYRAVPSYDKTLRNIIPLGWQDSKKSDFGKYVRYIRIPRDETHRMISGVLSLAISQGKDGLGDLPQKQWDFLDGQVPSLHPILDIANKWRKWMANQNPRDEFRGRNIIPNDAYLVGGWEANKAMLTWTYNKTGLNNFIRYDSRADTTLDMTVGAIPGLNRLLKTSDFGFREQQYQQESVLDAERSMQRLKLDNTSKDLRRQYYRIRNINSNLRSAEQWEKYQSVKLWHRNIYTPIEEKLMDPDVPDHTKSQLRTRLKTLSELYKKDD